MSKILTVLALVLCLAAFAPQASAAPTSPLSVPITATGQNALGQNVTFNGVFNLLNFAVQNGQVVANGVVTGTLTNTVTGVVTSVIQNVSSPVTTAAGATCNILHLDIKPITLNILGLQLTTSEIVIDLTAIPGPGNLLGNLLCDVANLLNNPGGLAGLLNNILGILRGL